MNGYNVFDNQLIEKDKIKRKRDSKNASFRKATNNKTGNRSSKKFKNYDESIDYYQE